ncbi:hypothetical protein [Tropicibacter sp. Alg240-R139]|uniref:hypothetical protein n=1 Tax=Tropicibacter sp. Alg240-R139 TaxID=2305991 RepID=UPI0013DE96F7|nr:hypothetical protein [Tropicibacter sp. Alg240-R139]
MSRTDLTPEVIALTEFYQTSDWSVPLVIVVLYLIMGMFLDPVGIMLLTLPFSGEEITLRKIAILIVISMGLLLAQDVSRSD